MDVGDLGKGGTSTVEKLTCDSVKSVIQKNGVSVDDFSKLLDPNRTLSHDELGLVTKIRSEIGIPTKGTVMNKAIPQSDIYKFLYDENYNGVRGFVSVDEHSSSLKGLNDIFERNRLDYDGTAFKTGFGVDGVPNSIGSPDSVYGKITYTLKDADSVRIPTDIATEANIPYTARGFTGSKNIVLPELVQVKRNFTNGDIFNIINSKTGEIFQQFVYDKKLGWVLK